MAMREAAQTAAGLIRAIEDARTEVEAAAEIATRASSQAGWCSHSDIYWILFKKCNLNNYIRINFLLVFDICVISYLLERTRSHFFKYSFRL